MATAHTKSSSMNPLASSLRGVAGQVRGENGAWKKGDQEVIPHLKTMTDCIRSGAAATDSELQNARDRFLGTLRWAIEQKSPEMVRHAMVMIMLKREPRDAGEGEKIISLTWFMEAYKMFPKTMLDMIRQDIFGLFGCYQDYNRLLEMISQAQHGTAENDHLSTLAEAIRDTMLKSRTKDLRMLDTFLEEVSQIEATTHWARRGIRGFESLPGDDADGREGRCWVLRKYLDEVTATVKSVDGDEIKVTYPYLDRVQAKTGRRPKLMDLSMAGKWIGSEGAKYARSVRIVQKDSRGGRVYDNYLDFMIRGGLKSFGPSGERAFPVEQKVPSGAKAQYRKRNAALRSALKVTELYMAAKRFGEIKFDSVCSRCLQLNAKAFLNELRKKAPAVHEELRGNRHPEDEDRVLAREHLREFFKGEAGKKLNTKGLLPHELMWKASKTTSTAERDLYDQLVTNMIDEQRKSLAEAKAKMMAELEASGTPEDLHILKILKSAGFLAMSDTSGSMTWGGGEAPNRPWDISVGLGAYMALLNEGPWHGLCMSFDHSPQIFDVSGMSPSDAISKIQSASRGYTTNLGAAITSLFDHMQRHKLSHEDMPLLVVLTDGEFNDTALNHDARMWDTTYEWIVKEAARRGLDGVPTICWWNLKSERVGVQNSDRTKGTLMLQGRSKTAIRYLLEAQAMPTEEQTVVVDGVAKTVKVSTATPLDTFLKQVTQEFWAPIDEVLVRSQEGILADYHGLPTEGK